jgi:SAM-dependent methyltransferase
MHGSEAPSEWVVRWSHLAPQRSIALDVACGAGRHLRWLHHNGHPVVGVDHSPQALASSEGLGELHCADIENGPWPLAGRQFGLVVVTNYLWRPLLPTIAASVALGGALVYETFAHGNETVGRPSRPDFLLQPGELLQAFAGMRVVAYEDGFLPEPARFVQRIAAVREVTDASSPARYRLDTRAS